MKTFLFAFAVCICAGAGCIGSRNVGESGNAGNLEWHVSDSLQWRISGDTLIISGAGEMPGGYDSDRWDGDIERWYLYRGRVWRGIAHVAIGDSVTAIGNYAFSGCSDLTSVSMGHSVRSIGEYAFDNCSDLTSVSMGHSVRSIGEYAFANCSGLTSVSIPDSVTTIGEYAFLYCSRLRSVRIGHSVTSIGKSALSGCPRLASITIAAGNTVYSSEDDVLFNADKTTLIAFPRGKKGSYAVPCTVETIGIYGFSESSGLTSITIPSSVKTIGDSAFYDCEHLTSIKVAPGNPAYSSRGGILFNKDKTDIVACPSGRVDTTGNLKWAIWGDTLIIRGKGEMPYYGMCAEGHNGAPWSGYYMTHVDIGKGVTSIAYNAFCCCDSLRSVTIPNSVTSIGLCAFLGCGSLRSITIPNSVKTIGNEAFKYCASLTSVTIGHSVTTIEEGTFMDCSSLTSVSIGNSVTSISEYNPFQYCGSLTSIRVASDNPAFSSKDGVLFNKDTTELVVCPGGKKGSYAVPGTVKSIRRLAFYDCEGLTAITIPPSVTSIGDIAFAHCDRLTSIQVTDDNPAYSSEDGVLFNKDTTELVVFPEGKKGHYTIPGTVSSIGIGAFYHCEGLTSVTIPNSVKTIGSSNFYNFCLNSLTIIGNSIKEVGSRVFWGCSPQVVILTATVPPPPPTSYMFVDRSSRTLYVPAGSVSLYQKDEVWGSFGEIKAIPKRKSTSP